MVYCELIMHLAFLKELMIVCVVSLIKDLHKQSFNSFSVDGQI